MKPNLKPIALVAPLLIAVALLAGCKADKDDDDEKGKGHSATAAATKPDEAERNQVKISADAVTKYGIKVEAVGMHELAETFVAPGRVGFNTEAMAHVGSAVKGRVWELKARLGDTVAKDAELFVVESPELGEAQSDYLQKRTAVTAAQAVVEPAKNAYDRAKALQEKNEGITLTEVQKRQSDYHTAAGAVEAAKAAVTAAENKLRLFGLDAEAIAHLARSGEVNPRFKVRAPIAGQVIERTVTQGELVAPEKESLLVIADVSTLYVIADVPEARLAGVKKGADAKVRIAAAGDAAVAGKVSFIAPALSTATRTVEVRVEVPNAKGELRPGMFAEIEIARADEKPKPVVAVRDDAVLAIDGHPVVFVPGDEPGEFVKREVKLGRTVGDWVEILSGLKDGDKVVSAGGSILKAELTKPPKEEE